MTDNTTQTAALPTMAAVNDDLARAQRGQPSRRTQLLLGFGSLAILGLVGVAAAGSAPSAAGPSATAQAAAQAVFARHMPDLGDCQSALIHVSTSTADLGSYDNMEVATARSDADAAISACSLLAQRVSVMPTEGNALAEQARRALWDGVVQAIDGAAAASRAADDYQAGHFEDFGNEITRGTDSFSAATADLRRVNAELGLNVTGTN